MDWFDTGKDLFNKARKWGETIGDMTAASDNPVEKNGWMDEQQKKIEQQQKTALLRPVIPKVQKQAAPFAQTPQSDAVPDTSTTPDNEPVYDWTGHPVSEEERQRILSNRARERAENPDDINGVLDDLKKLRQERNAPNQKAFRFDSDVPETRQASPEKSAFEKAAEVSIPQDETLTPFFNFLNDHARNGLGENSGWRANPPTHPDLSYGPFGQVLAQSANQGLGFDSKVHGHDGKRIAGQTDQSYKSATDFAAENITNNLGNKSAVSGYGRAPVGHPDSSYDPAIGDVSKNFGLDSAVTGHGRQVIGHPNMSYWGNWQDDRLREMPLDFTQKGVQQGMKDMQILFYSGASLAGEHLFNLVGGDDTSLRRVQGILDQHQKERQNMGRLNVDRIHVEGDPEKTMQNMTQYLYQELGNQTVKLPAYYVAAHLNTFAQLFGVSSAVLSSQFYADFRERTGDGHAAESVMYGVPLGLMSAALLPFRDSGVFQSAKEVRDYVQSMVVGAAVHKAQDDGRKKIVDGFVDKNNIKKTE